MEFISAVFFLFVIVCSAILHEYMHGWVADRLGDPTARYAGRLTLNPKAHIDPFGSIIIPLVLFLSTAGQFLFAYAKPVPYNPYNLKNQKWGPVLVAIAGPLSNFFLALVFGLFVQFVPDQTASELFSVVVYANVLLAVFNLVPIPPLDGSKLLFAVLPDSMVQVRVMLERFGIVFLFAFILFFSHLLTPIMSFFFNLFVGA